MSIQIRDEIVVVNLHDRLPPSAHYEALSMQADVSLDDRRVVFDLQHATIPAIEAWLHEHNIEYRHEKFERASQV